MPSPSPVGSARWALRALAPPAVVREIARALSLPPLLASVLYARGFGADIPGALEPPLALTQIPDLGAAAERLEHALRSRRRILVHGDYDADGISGTAVLTLGLRALGGDVTPYIPNRLEDGYGIHPARVTAHAERAQLFLTVDCGIGNLREIAALQAAGVEVIVTDHHQPGPELPECLIVHPKLSPLARRGLPELTGAGVAFHLLWALHERLGLEPPFDYADLATLGVIADVAPLLGENRALVQLGLSRMADTKWPGLRAAMRQSRLKGPPSARDVAFVLAPRLNAAGRLGEAEAGLELLMSASERRARELAVYLDARNAERRKIQDAMFESALAKVDPEAPALVLDDPEWHPGVMGIVASKLLERYYKPVYIMARGKGSVRSTPGISAVEGLRAAQAHLLRFGGHSQAAGFAIREGAVPGFRQAIFRYVADHPEPVRRYLADALLLPEEVDEDLYRASLRLEPYGEGHPEPLFALSGRLEAARAVGANGATLQLRVGGVKGVAWQRGEQAATLSVGALHSVLVNLRENVWNERRSIEFLAEDLRPQMRLGFTEEVEVPTRLYATRSRPPGEAEVFAEGDPLPAPEGGPLWLKRLPLAEVPGACAPLERLVRAGRPLYFDLSEAALAAAEARLAHCPSVHDLRCGFVALRRGQRLPFAPEKAALVERALHELELLDARGRVRREKRDPYHSDTLLAGLVERYQLQTFLKAYRQLDDAAFARAVEILFGEP